MKIQTNEQVVIVAKLNAAAWELVLMEIRFKEIHKILSNLLDEQKAAVFIICAWWCHRQEGDTVSLFEGAHGGSVWLGALGPSR